MEDAEQVLYAGRVKDEEGKFDEAFSLYQQGLEKLMEKLKQPTSSEKKDHYKNLLSTYLSRAEVIKKKKSRASVPQVQEIRIANDETGWSFAKLFTKPLADSPTHIRIQDPYLHARHQLSNLVSVCEVFARVRSVSHIRIITRTAPPGDQRTQQQKCMRDLGDSLEERQVTLVTNYSETLHDREIRFKNDNHVVWVAILGRGLDMYKKLPSWFHLGATDYTFRKCHEVTVTLTRG
ncbi:MIT domain-containing protein 1-like [Bolinopsis microptera]|uniref:MIT domain-containing protein 1-like n=1 Tax=Bolinopsis microptera TaxID=2820187 RepID=UPI003078ED97